MKCLRIFQKNDNRILKGMTDRIAELLNFQKKMAEKDPTAKTNKTI